MTAAATVIEPELAGLPQQLPTQHQRRSASRTRPTTTSDHTMRWARISTAPAASAAARRAGPGPTCRRRRNRRARPARCSLSAASRRPPRRRARRRLSKVAPRGPAVMPVSRDTVMTESGAVRRAAVASAQPGLGAPRLRADRRGPAAPPRSPRRSGWSGGRSAGTGRRACAASRPRAIAASTSTRICGERRRHARAGQDRQVRLGRDVGVRDLLPVCRGDLGGVLGEAPGGVAAQLVRLVLSAPRRSVRRPRPRRSRRARRRRPGPRPRCATTAPCSRTGRQVLGVVLVVPAVAQEGVRQPGVEDRLLGDLVLGGQRRSRRSGPPSTLVYASCATPAAFAASITAVCCGTRRPTSLPEISSTRSPARKAPASVSGAAVVGRSVTLDAARGEVGGLLLVADDGGDLVGRDLAPAARR